MNSDNINCSHLDKIAELKAEVNSLKEFRTEIKGILLRLEDKIDMMREENFKQHAEVNKKIADEVKPINEWKAGMQGKIAIVGAAAALIATMAWDLIKPIFTKN